MCVKFNVNITEDLFRIMNHAQGGFIKRNKRRPMFNEALEYDEKHLTIKLEHEIIKYQINNNIVILESEELL